jgi:membrane carboxypeptidase/penicillin-binding protein
MDEFVYNSSMSALPQIIKSRHRREKRERKSFITRLSRFALFVVIALSLIFSILIIATSILFANLSKSLPSLDTLPLILESHDGQLPPPSRLLDNSGQHLIAILENSNASGRIYLSLQADNRPQVPNSLISATIASTDPSFWTNRGFIWSGIQTGPQSTITQKLISDNLLWDQAPSIKRSIVERILATQVNARYGREQILEWYINSTYYGNLAYGADAAARIYFGKPATRLSLAEVAILAAAAEFPFLNPIDAPIAALDAKDKILQEMYAQDMISADQLRAALDEQLEFEPAQGFSFDLAPDFTRLAVEQASQFIPPDRIFRGGLNIISSLDYDLQNQVECTSFTQISRIINAATEDIVEHGLEECEMARLLPSLQGEPSLPHHSIASSVIVMDPNNGHILAMVGGIEPDSNPNNQPGRPPGSILTPFIYLTSFSRGSSPASLLWDIPANLVAGFSDIQNIDGQFHGPVSVRTALTNDYLVPALQVLTQMDPDQVWHTSQQLGLGSLQIPSGQGAYRLPFEGGEATLLELSQAYGVLAAQGILAGISQDTDPAQNQNSPINPQVILKVKDNSGNDLVDCTGHITECRTIKRPVISPQLAHLITDILSDETARWPSLGHPNPLEIGRPAAVKLGRTTTQNDSWTVGYTPEMVSAVWLGTGTSNQGIAISQNWAAGLWHAIMQYATRDKPVEEFIPPPGIIEMKVCYPSGLLPTDECPRIVNEVFTIGNEPTQTDNLFQTYLINRETGRLATIFTSPALIDEKVFMVVPPEAEEWAKETNIPTIPESYDVLDINPIQSMNARITSPSMFSTIRGSVPIIGRAAGEGFDSYRLQIGAGLNPHTWLQIGEDVRNPVQSGKLGVWETNGLSGLYALQLIVTFEDDIVESTTVQVTVDNQKPHVLIRYPQESQEIRLSDIEAITILADVSDDLELAEVEFFINGELVAILSSPPYAIPWEIKIGEHSLRVRASDRAGNVSDARVRILVEE